MVEKAVFGADPQRSVVEATTGIDPELILCGTTPPT
jgi:hypothetical protein